MICIYIITDQLSIGSVKHWDYEDDKYSFLPVLFPFSLPSQMVSVDHLLEKPFVITSHESSSNIL